MTRPFASRSLGAGLAALAVLLAFGAAPALGRTVYVAALTGDAEVPGPGDPAGEGFAQLSIDLGAGQLCWDLFVDLGEAAVAAHVHDGDAGTAGPVVVTLGTPDENGESVDCLDGLDPSLLQSIVDDPAGFYVNVHTDTYPDGAIRGQLDGLEIVTLSVGKLACPAGVDGPEDLGGPGDPQCSTVRPGPIDAPPDGYVWDPEPVGFDWAVEVIEPDDNVLTEADASGEGGGTCNTVTLTCGTSFGYEFGEILAGDTEVTQLSVAAGLRVRMGGGLLRHRGRTRAGRDRHERVDDRLQFERHGRRGRPVLRHHPRRRGADTRTHADPDAGARCHGPARRHSAGDGQRRPSRRRRSSIGGRSRGRADARRCARQRRAPHRAPSSTSG